MMLLNEFEFAEKESREYFYLPGNQYRFESFYEQNSNNG